MAVGVDLEHFLAVGVAPKPLAQPQKSAAITLKLEGEDFNARRHRHEDVRLEAQGTQFGTSRGARDYRSRNVDVHSTLSPS